MKIFKAKIIEIDSYNNHILLNELKCTGCANYMKPPIVQCELGHSSCQQCGIKTRCSQCGSIIINTRNLHLENVSLKVKYPCNNSGAGCKGYFSLAELKGHEERCCYRMQECLLGENCHWTGSVSGLESHVSRSHLKDMVMKKNNTFLYKKFRDVEGRFSRLLKAYGHLFWYHHFKNDNSVYWSIQYIGTDVKAAGFCFDFKIINPYDEEKNIGYKKISCLLNGDDPADAFAEGKSCVYLSLDTIQSFTDVEGNIVCSICVRKCEISKKNV